MTNFTLRLDDVLARRFDKVCRELGCNKTELIKSLIKNYLATYSVDLKSRTSHKKGIRSLVGIVRLGGDSVKDADNYFDDMNTGDQSHD